MNSPIVIFLVAAAVFSVIDFVWLGMVANKVYRSQLGFLLREKPNVPAAIVFYLLNIVGLLVFVVVPALHQPADMQIGHAVLYGALFGLFTYGTYDLTNLATVKNWPLMITAIDMTWGIVLTAATSAITVAIIG